MVNIIPGSFFAGWFNLINLNDQINNRYKCG